MDSDDTLIVFGLIIGLIAGLLLLWFFVNILEGEAACVSSDALDEVCGLIYNNSSMVFSDHFGYQSAFICKFHLNLTLNKDLIYIENNGR